MQWIRARWASTTLVAAPALVAGLIVSAAWAQTGGGTGGTGGKAGQSSTAQTPGQQPSSPSAPGAADQRQSGASTSRQDAGGTTQSPGTSPPARETQNQQNQTRQSQTQPNQEQQNQTQQNQARPGVLPTPPRFGSDPNRANRNQADPNRTADPSARQRTSGQTLREFQFGGQLRGTDDGLMVGTIQEDGFFHNAGILEGDRIILVNGQSVTSEAQFRQHLLAARGRFPVVVLRDGQREEIMVNADDLQTAADVPPQERMDDRAALGIWFHAMPEGAHIVHVVPGSPAKRAGLREGDFIVSLNREPCHDWQAVTERIARAERQSAIEMQVFRDGQTMDAEATLGGYWEVFSEDKDWSEVAAEQGFAQQGMRMDGYGRSGDWTGRANASGGQYDGTRMQQGVTPALEQRVRQLEQEVGDLREQLNRGGSTNAPRERQDRRDHGSNNDNGRRTSAPAERQDNGQRTDAPPDGQ
jgi:hypothetical protein